MLALVDDETDPVCDDDILAEALVQVLADDVANTLIDEDTVPDEVVDTDSE